jgi:murein L,D-transpeptidase YafK
MKLKPWIVLGFCLASLGTDLRNAFAEGEFYPSSILKMDPKFSHHVFLVEKQTHKLYIFENTETFPKLLKTFSMMTGKFKGNKSMDGDHKTPEGIYDLYDFFTKESLLRRFGDYGKIYGAGAFPMNYPNVIDEMANKKGSGIWLHSTDDDSRISKELDSKGCVVVQNQDLKEISQYIEMNHTPIIVTQDLTYLSKETWERNRKDLSDAVEKWMKAWQSKDFETYMSAYDSQFRDKTRGNIGAYRDYKKAVFGRADKPEIRFTDLSIMATPEYAVVYFQQDYKSSAVNDIGKKTLYLRREGNYEWKIVSEIWSKIEGSKGDATVFQPSNRFFQGEALTKQ